MLKDFESLHPATKTNLLLGNGFSIGIYNKFSYSSLLNVAHKQGFITSTELRLFKKFNTVNFELILSQLSNASIVNKILDIDYKLPKGKYNLIRDALIKCINYVHPQFSELDDSWLKTVSAEFINYKGIYTTNYDLILYWIMSQSEFRKFTDYFWSQNLTFDQFNTELWNKNIPVHYLHGALFIFVDAFNVKKVKKTDSSSLLSSIDKQLRKNEVPLFISEGAAKQKKQTIYKDPYLTFVYKCYLNMKKGLTIYGFSFSDSDSHIVSGINENEGLKHIAVSIYTKKKNKNDIKNEVGEIKNKLNPFRNRKNATLEFFNCNTSPFYYNE